MQNRCEGVYNGQMFGENKNLKDPEGKPLASYGAGSQDVSVISYAKTNKLITALYMVTDIIDTNEPLRNKLRTLGVEIISDMHLVMENNIGHLASNIHSKISQITSFLEIASTINIISEMNCSILRKEFLELNQSILPPARAGEAQAGVESTGKVTINKQINLSEFFREELPVLQKYQSPPERPSGRAGIGHSIGHNHTSVGVQKGSTLMKALSDKTSMMSDRNTRITHTNNFVNNFDVLKKQRRDEIINIIKTVGGNATIKDIRDKATGLPADGQGALVSCSEKTLQRELISMVKDGVLNKTGEKRWSRYFLK